MNFGDQYSATSLENTLNNDREANVNYFLNRKKKSKCNLERWINVSF